MPTEIYIQATSLDAQWCVFSMPTHQMRIATHFLSSLQAYTGLHQAISSAKQEPATGHSWQVPKNHEQLVHACTGAKLFLAFQIDCSFFCFQTLFCHLQRNQEENRKHLLAERLA
jgi:hypothetical protein